MSTMDRALAAIANGETLTTEEVRARTTALQGNPGTPNIGTMPRRERLVSLG